MSQTFGETLRGHLVYQPCNTAFSSIINSYVTRKHKVMKTDTQMVFRNKGIFMQALFRVFGGKYILGSNICVFIIIFRTVFLGTTKFGEEKIV